ncbi:MAG: PAS domain-containing protein [Helicobacteraceae bacterium]|jgi:aerotaxis receptor|nr:PAS domain-containing protein [Helicobacteraceae bacterium]
MAEIVLRDDHFLVSQTNEKGVITFANDDFLKVCRYSLKELIGRQHNIVRHPDMPKAAFKQLWDTIQSGDIWTGFVKNRAKNGDFYWVYATIMQTTSCDGEKAYISARRKPNRAEIAEAEALYKTLQ